MRDFMRFTVLGELIIIVFITLLTLIASLFNDVVVTWEEYMDVLRFLIPIYVIFSIVFFALIKPFANWLNKKNNETEN